MRARGPLRLHLVRIVCATGLLAGALGSAFPLKSSAQERVGPIAVELTGVSGAERTNVEGILSVSRLGDRPIDEGQARRYLARASREVSEALSPLGFYEASARTELDWGGGRWRATVSIESGLPVVIRTVELDLGDNALAERIEPRLPPHTVRPNEVLHHGSYETLKRSILAAAIDLGHLDASFDSAVVRVDRSRRIADVVLRLEPGPRYRLGPVNFIQDAVDPAILRRLVPWRVGAAYEGRYLLELQQGLSGEPYVASAQVVAARDRAIADTVPIDVYLTMDRPQRYSVGGGYGSDTGPRGTLVAEFRRLNRRGHSAEADFRVSVVERRATGRWLIPLRGRRASVLTLSGGYADLTPETSDTQTFLGSATVGGLLGTWRLEVSLSAQRSDFEVGADRGITSLVLGGVGLSRIRADDRIDPTRGSLLRLRVRGGPDVWISEVTLLDVGVEGRVVWSPTERTRLRARAEAGRLTTGSFSSLPGTLRYFAGGDRSVRGYGYRSIGPTDEAGEPVGGDRLLVASTEAEFRVVPILGIATFVDGGSAGRGSFDELEWGAGVGLRWRSPVGMIRLDTAWAIGGGSQPKLHLSLGPEL